jgi:hypothetical protein
MKNFKQDYLFKNKYPNLLFIALNHTMRRKSFTFPVSTLIGSNLSNIRAIFRNHKPERKYYPKLALTLLVVGFFEVFHLWERLRWDKKIRAFRLEKPPVFIIGFWRSGTTLLHNLMCQDPEASFTTTLHTVFRIWF